MTASLPLAPIREAKVSDRPLVSVVMANHCGAPHLPAAIASVLAQTVSDIELIVADDASSDASAALVRRAATRDSRVTLIEMAENGGPSAARNAALRAARGTWIAVVDSDDIIHPERFERMLERAEALQADGVADDMVFFSEDGPIESKTLLGASLDDTPQEVSPAYFIRANGLNSGLPALGYLKPILKREKLAALSYDEAIRVGEDYDFLLRFLLDGNRFFLLPEPTYLYRRHSGSISHRLSEEKVEAMITNQKALQVAYPTIASEAAEALSKRMKGLKGALAYEQLVSSLKRKAIARSATLVAKRPTLVAPLIRSAREHFSHPAKTAESTAPTGQVLLLREELPDADLQSTVMRTLGIVGDGVGVAVPPFREKGGMDAGERQSMAELTQSAALNESRVIAFGLAGLRAASLCCRGTLRAVVIEDAKETPAILQRLDGLDVEMLVRDPANGDLAPLIIESSASPERKRA